MVKHQAQLFTWLEQDVHRMALLQQAAKVALPDWCLSAGFVRNLVWDHLSGAKRPTPLNDIDLVYFDAERCDAQRDRALEQCLASVDGEPWSVKNQARMHLRSGRPPFSSSEDAISYWVELETAVGVRLNAGQQLELVAPFGLDALFASTVTHNPRHGNRDDFERRILDKGWLQRWPNLRVRD